MPKLIPEHYFYQDIRCHILDSISFFVLPLMIQKDVPKGANIHFRIEFLHKSIRNRKLSSLKILHVGVASIFS